MFIRGSYAVALVMMLLGMIFWGSWPNSYKLTHKWRFELFYSDYVLGIFLTAVVVGLTMGTFFGPQTFLQNLFSADSKAWFYALLAGFLWNCGNILLVAGVALVGLAVAFPVSIGMALVVGVVGSYIITPKGDATLLFAPLGVAQRGGGDRLAAAAELGAVPRRRRRRPWTGHRRWRPCTPGGPGRREPA